MQTINTDKAISRFKWRLTNGKFTPNNNDLEAFKDFARVISFTKKESLKNDNLLFKLMMKLLLLNLNHYGDLEIAFKALRDTCSFPVELHLTQFKSTLDAINLKNYRDKFNLSHDIGIKSSTEFKDFLNTLDDGEKEKCRSAILGCDKDVLEDMLLSRLFDIYIGAQEYGRH